MKIARRSFLAGGLALRGEGAQPDFRAYSDADKERFLKSARIVSAKEIGHGVTKPLKLEMTLAGVQHAAKVQRVDVELPDYFPEKGRPVPMRDSWKYNIAAYRVDRVLGLGMAVVVAPRAYAKRPAAFSWWVDDVKGEEIDRVKQNWVAPDPEGFARQQALGKVFDELIFNIDRNLSNLLITNAWRLVLIDHSRCFTAFGGIRNRENLQRCSRGLLAGMRKLEGTQVRTATEGLLTQAEIDAMLQRRDAIVKFFEDRAKSIGEEKVLFG